MVRLAVAGVCVLVAVLTIAAWIARVQAQGAQASGSATTTATQSPGTATTTAGSTVEPSFGSGTFLGQPTPATAQQGATATTFLGVPNNFPTGTVTASGTATGASTTATTTLGGATTATGADISGATLPYTILYAPSYAYQPVPGGAVALAQGPAGVSAAPPGMIAVPVGTAGTLLPNGSPLGLTGQTAAGSRPAPSVGVAPPLPTVKDGTLLRQAQEKLRSSAGLGSRTFSVDVQRGIIRVTTHGLTAAERDRIFNIARDVHGSIGVIVTNR